ncbi:MAG TPA: hypothetical protein VFJ02_14710 [Vicinamibacterales bacterium]|nr:hypothetical protein [Vicinamibacterales bacterium]
MMNDRRGSEQDAGLCASCVHAHVIRNDRGSRFYLCRLSAVDARFAKYPVLPVVACIGFTRAPADPAERK